MATPVLSCPALPFVMMSFYAIRNACDCCWHGKEILLACHLELLTAPQYSLMPHPLLAGMGE